VRRAIFISDRRIVKCKIEFLLYLLLNVEVRLSLSVAASIRYGRNVLIVSQANQYMRSKKIPTTRHGHVLDLEPRSRAGKNTSLLNHSYLIIIIIAYKTRIFPIKFFFLFSLRSLCSFTFSHFCCFFSFVVCRWQNVLLCALLLSDDVSIFFQFIFILTLLRARVDDYFRYHHLLDN
jgi:hypothetical protein